MYAYVFGMKQGIIVEAKYENTRTTSLLDKSSDRVIRRAKPFRKREIHFKFSTPLSISYASHIEQHPSPLLLLTHSKPSED